MPWKAVTYRAVGGEVLHSLRRAEASGEGHPAWREEGRDSWGRGRSQEGFHFEIVLL